MALTHTDVAAILEQLQNMSMDEFTIEVGEVRIHASRGGFAQAPPPVAGGKSEAAHIAPAAPAIMEAVAPAAIVIPEDHQVVPAPMVGTFYRRPSPDADPFVEVGARIEKDAPVALVEVMKLFTTLYAPVTGTVTQICADDATLVEYGQPLVVIEPDE